MQLGWILLTVVVFLIVSKLISVLGQEPKGEKIRFVSDKTGDVLEMTLISEKKAGLPGKKETSGFNQDDFLIGAKMAFNAVVDAFAGGRVDTLKTFLAPRVYDSFVQAIEERKAKEQKMEFTLISFVSCKILEQSDEKNPLTVTVDFVTEQTNALRDKMGQVLEGDPIFIGKVHDVWTFQKENKSKNTWIVSATKSEAFNG